jgi:hypothetical protein
MVTSPVEFLDFGLEVVPALAIIPREKLDNILNRRDAVMGKQQDALFGFDTVKFTFDIELVKVIGGVLTGKDIERARLARTRPDASVGENGNFGGGEGYEAPWTPRFQIW